MLDRSRYLCTLKTVSLHTVGSCVLCIVSFVSVVSRSSFGGLVMALVDDVCLV